MQGRLIEALSSRGAAPAAAGVVPTRIPIADAIIKAAAGDEVGIRLPRVDQGDVVDKVLARILDIDVDPAAGGRAGDADRAPLIFAAGHLGIHGARVGPAGRIVGHRIGDDLFEAEAETIGADVPVLRLSVAG